MLTCAPRVQVLLRLSASGHKVLLFCTMTRALDVIEDYLTWRCVGVWLC
jgi:SWI/SNF-related matrix-associated actin-dependent regulator of chromatin subfamily A protein 2/4